MPDLLPLCVEILAQFTLLTVTLGDLLDFVLLSDGVAVGGVLQMPKKQVLASKRTNTMFLMQKLETHLSSVHKLVGKAFTHSLHSSESGLSSADSDEGEGEIDPSHGRHVDSLLSHDTCSTNSGRVFSGTSVNDGLNNNLQRILSTHKVDDLQAVSNDSDSEGLLTSVSAVEHKRVNKSLNNRALRLSELLSLPSASRVRNVDLSLGLVDRDIVLESDLFNLNLGVVPSAEKLGAGNGGSYGGGSGGWYDLLFNL